MTQTQEVLFSNLEEFERLARMVSDMLFLAKAEHEQMHPDKESKKALPITDAELKLIANAAIIGESSHPVNGYSTPAAKGIPNAL
ncbi:unnamed protein product [Oppiella nova]|uniref:Uncharacterized protein n=1 Tax=Oppiella nova TaxID=334625 RepID=A0A7R9Q913_9ACAR|nr:unnamed protein product [Oppiella nova]CAG2158974.1 unnamed protein product [Oppiella nova]